MFTTGGGSADPLNWSNDEAALYPVSQFKGMRPASGRTIDMFFETSFGKEVVTLGIKNITHTLFMKSITQAIEASKVVATIADVDNAVYCSPYIQTVTIASQENYVQKITGNKPTLIDIPRSNYSSCLIANTDDTVAVGLNLFLTSQVGSDITDTGVNVNNGSGYSITTSSQVVAVDGTSPSAEIFGNALNPEKVYKSDGTFIGTAHYISGSNITFSGGLEVALADDDDLYTGTRYTLFHTLTIPVNSTLKLEQDEISFNGAVYNLYCQSGDSDGQLTFTFTY